MNPCTCAKWRWRALAIRWCHLASQMEYEENIAYVLGQATVCQARADAEECNAGKLHP